MRKWLIEWGSKLAKANFVNLLSKVWHEGLTPSNVIIGFRTTGIYLADREKYPKSWLDPRLLKRYDTWLKSGKPDDLMEELATAVNALKKFVPEKDASTPLCKDQPTSSINFDITSLPGASTLSPNVSQTQETSKCETCKELGPNQ